MLDRRRLAVTRDDAFLLVFISASRAMGSVGRLSLLAAPADVDAPVVSRRFLATVELAIWEALGNAAAVR